MVRASMFFCLVCLAGPAFAQAPPAAQTTPAGQTPGGSPALAILQNLMQAGRQEVEGDHTRLVVNAEVPLSDGAKVFADTIDIYADSNRFVAGGNVVFTNAEGRIAAESVEFDLATGKGTFHQAYGIMSLGPKVDRAQFGGQDPDVYFYGNTIEKLGDRRYKITRGGFSTCVQPTPRWEVVSNSVTLNLNEYAIAHNTVLRVKGVPLMYLPIVYYPIQDDDRATGFLLPTYGTSTYRGQAVSNAFFWAIGRSQDATFFHDWFTRAGQGEGAEYRYVESPESSGTFRAYRFSRKQTEYTTASGVSVLSGGSSYEVTANATQAISPRFRARTRIDYFSDVVDQLLLHQNIYNATRRNRLIDGGVTGTVGPWSTSAQYQRNDLLNSATDTIVYGGTPRVTGVLAAQRLFNSPVYVSVNTEGAYLPYNRYVNGAEIENRSYGRLDLAPTVRVPLSKLTFLSVNTSASYRTTYYTRSQNASQQFVDDSYLRRYASLRTELVGPVFTRIWDRPNGDFAERLKHVIEPAFTVDLTSPIDEYTRTPTGSDISDLVVGGTTRLTYGITNRLFARSRGQNGGRGQTREFVTVGVQQTYYSNAAASRSDTAYQSTNGSSRLVDLSPVAVNVRVSPSGTLDANARLEYDVSGGGLQVFSAGGSVTRAFGSTSLNYSRRQFSRSSPADDYLSVSTRLQLLQRRATGTYSLNWDIGRSYVATQSFLLSYLAQCCGFQVEFQKYNFLQGSGIPLASDRRFNFGFVLAGLGTFSNFFGAFGGQPR